MPKFFEQIGSWLDVKGQKPERTAHEFVEYSDDLAVIRPDTPQELMQQAIALAAMKGFTEPLPSADTKGQAFCRLAQFERLAIDKGLVKYLSDDLALIKPDIPEENKERFVDLVNRRGFTEPLPWKEMRGQLFCRQADFARMSKAQEVGDGSMTFKRSLVDESLVSELEKYCNGYAFDKPLAVLPDAKTQPFIVLVKTRKDS